jgi:hypothetical protein
MKICSRYAQRSKLLLFIPIVTLLSSNLTLVDSYVEETENKMQIISRQMWGAAEPVNDMHAQIPDTITLHHSGVEYTGRPIAKEYIKAIQGYHQREMGWADIAYHFIIDLEGNVYEGRSTDWVGDTATEYDPSDQVLICVLGNYEIQQPSEKQLDSISQLMVWIMKKHNIKRTSIAAHKDLAKTVCPGKNLYHFLENGFLAQKIDLLFEEDQ